MPHFSSDMNYELQIYNRKCANKLNLVHSYISMPHYTHKPQEISEVELPVSLATSKAEASTIFSQTMCKQGFFQETC